jgi:hypothetical protein
MHTMQILRSGDPNRRARDFRFALCLWILFSGIGVATAQIPPAVVSLTAASGGQGWTLDGPEFLARAGAAINGDCDLNGDGFPDLLIGATGAGPSDQGMAFVVFGSPSGATPPSSLNNAGLRMTGEVSGDAAGASVACVGDVNADGFDDVLIGAPFADAPGVPNTGAAYLVYGGENLPSAMSLSSAGMRIHGMVNTQKIGAVLAGGGDINGDGYTDLLLTAPNFGTTASNLGQAYVIFGSASLPAVFALGSLNGSNGFAVASAEPMTNSLGTAAAIGLVNGDNFPDVVLGAPGAAPGGLGSAGSVFVVYGHGGAFALQTPLNTLNGSNGFAIHGAVAGGKVGGSLSFVPDFNGNARPDLVIGAPGAANGLGAIGQGYLVFGAAGFPASFNLSGLNGSNGLALTSPAAGDVLGSSVAGLHDINGDGLGEVIFGAPGADFGVVDSGGAYVVFGRSSGLPANFALSSLNGSNGFRIQGVTADDFAGQTVSRLGDVNQDGIADLVVGSPEADPNTTMAAGRVYALFGNDFISNDPLFQNGFE